MEATGFFRGSGGSIIEMALPLPAVMQNQLTRGELVRVNADGSTYDEPSAEPAGELKRPAMNAPKNEWVGFAVGQGVTVDDADAMTKADLIEKFGGKG